ncbi:MAG: M15 family metallopeptidase, partial [Acidimicrobiia bacterium]
TFISGPNAARAFGSFGYIQNEDGTIAPDPAWVKKNIVKSKVPILGDVVCHRYLIPQLKAALSEIEGEGAAASIDVADYHYQGGCFVPRLIRGQDPGRSVSMHAWGLAIDINVKQNPAGSPSKMDPRVVAAFERWGFRWGGRWSPPDAHHFELAALVQK